MRAERAVIRTIVHLGLSLALALPAGAQHRCAVRGVATAVEPPPSIEGSPFTFSVSFDANFTAAQRAVALQALAEWLAIVQEPGAIANPYPVHFRNGPLAGPRLADALTAWNSTTGAPVQCTITIDDDGSSEFFVDPTPADDAEFPGGACNDPACMGVVDLLTVLRHEIGHALGWTGAFGTPTNPRVVPLIVGTTFDPGRLNISMDPALTSHSSKSVFPGDIMNPTLPEEKRTGISLYPAAAMTARGIDHGLSLKFVDASAPPPGQGSADFPWTSVPTAFSTPAGTPLLFVPGDYDEAGPYTLSSAHPILFANFGGVVWR